MTKAVIMATAMTAGVTLGCSRSPAQPEPQTAQAATAYPEQTQPVEYAAPPPAPKPMLSAQETVDSAATALQRMESNSAFAELTSALREARGVMIFPRVQKGDLLVGGEGVNGVLVTRNAEGKWSAPAFYQLRSVSTAVPIGYDRANIVLVFMSDKALNSAIDRGLALGNQASIAPGLMGTDVISISDDVYTFANSGSVFLNLALEGTGVAPQEDRIQEYYGSKSATAASVVLDRTFDRAEASPLKDALSRVS